MTVSFKVAGKQALIERLHREYLDERPAANAQSIEVGPVQFTSMNESLRKPLGLEPMTYFVIAFTAHLAADLTGDKIRDWLKAKAKTSPGTFTVEEKPDTDKSE